MIRAVTNFMRRSLAEVVQAMSRSQILWFDADGILRDIDNRPIRINSVSKERVAEARARRRGAK